MKPRAAAAAVAPGSPRPKRPPTPPVLPAYQDLLIAFRLPLAIGNFLGLVPIQNHNQIYSVSHWRRFLTACITILIGINVIFISYEFPALLADANRKSTSELIGKVSGIWFYMAGMCVYVFFLTRTPSIVKFFKNWTDTSSKVESTTSPDQWLTWRVNVTTLIVLGSCFGENCMFHLYIMSDQVKSNILSGHIDLVEILENYYSTNGYMYRFFSFHWLVALILTCVNKLTLYAWNFGDVILMLLGHAFYGKFQGFSLYLERCMVADGCILMIRKGAVNWKRVRDNFIVVVALLEDANQIFAPLLWLSYLTDIFFVCNQLYIELSSSSSSTSESQPKNVISVGSVYVLWSFLHLVLRTLAVSLIGAKVNQAAHRLKHVLQYCYPEEYDTDVKRLEQYVNGKVIGLSANGCFVITSSFILMVTSAIFTLELVLLQNSPKKVQL